MSRHSFFVYYGHSFREGGHLPYQIPPPTWFLDIFPNLSRMDLRLWRWFAQPRIHFLRAWAPHGISGTKFPGLIIFANNWNYRQLWRFLEFWTPWFLGHHRLSIRCSQRSISLRQTLRKVIRAFTRLVTTFRNVCTVFHALWAADWGNWIFWFFGIHPFLSAIIDKKAVAW